MQARAKFAGKFRIVDEDMNELPPGTPGECVVRGPSVMSGYLEDPEATAEAFRGGWLHTGDLLVRHEDGTLSYVERKKYLIKTGGENVYPAEVEAALESHPGIASSAVIGLPDDDLGQRVHAIVQAPAGSGGTQTGWGFGPGFPGANWATYIQYTVQSCGGPE